MASTPVDGLTPDEFARLKQLSPADAMRWMQERTGGALTFSWQDLWQAEHSHHFTVSRLARLDLLQSLHESLSKSVAGDLSRRDWMRNAEQLLQEAGWWGENVEVNKVALRDMAVSDPKRVRPFVDQYTMKDGRKLNLLGEGRLINLAAAEGHPASVMDMSFAGQALSAKYLVDNKDKLENKVYTVPEEVDQRIAIISTRRWASTSTRSPNASINT